MKFKLDDWLLDTERSTNDKSRGEAYKRVNRAVALDNDRWKKKE